MRATDRPDRSGRAFARARAVLVGGVDSPVRSFAAVGGTPRFLVRGRGAWVTDLDGRRYLDLLHAWGALLLGHAPAPVIRAVRTTAARGLGFGAPSPLEHELAEEIRRAAPEMERIRFVSSGTEAVMSAIRVARGFTGRSKVVKFEGGYHGHSDGLLARAGSGPATAALPDSAGVPEPIVSETLVVPFNDPAALAACFEAHPGEIAAVVAEPVPANMSLVPPKAGFFAEVGRIARRDGALLIADEVITGFRTRRGLAHPALGARADLVTLGKIIGGGMPVGAYGGRRAVMATVAPEGPVYQAGTLSGHPVAMAAGLATLALARPARYRALERRSSDWAEAVRAEAERARVTDLRLTRVGSMFGLFLGPAAPEEYASAQRVDRARYARLFHAALDRGVYLPPSPLETAFLSMAYTAEEADRCAARLGAAFRALGPPTDGRR